MRGARTARNSNGEKAPMMYLQVVAGLVILVLGGEALVRGAVTLAERLGVSKALIGLTVVAFGTSAPELVVCLEAARSGLSELALGNVVGSNIANVLLVLGLPALIFPIACDRRVMLRDGAVMAMATLLFIALASLGEIRWWHGVILLVFLAAYLGRSYISARRGIDDTAAHMAEEIEQDAPQSLPVAALFVLAGLIALIAGSDFLVEGAAGIARSFGVSEAVIGLTLVALGTSLPELATSAVAAFRRHSDVAIGNVLGSNIFNILGILGITVQVSAIPVTEKFLSFDLWVLAGTLLALLPFAFLHVRIGRIAGLLYLSAYGLYVYAQFSGLSAVAAGMNG